MIPLFVSASQVDLFDTCQRKWYLAKVLKLPMPTTESQAKGIAVHKEIEVFYNTGELPHSEAAKEALKVLPQRSNVLLVEHKFNMPTYKGGPTWTGVIDLVDPYPLYPKPPIVIDHKTTKDLRWAKTPKEMKEGIQLSSYAKYIGEQYDSDEIEIKHVNIQLSKIPKVMPVSTTITSLEYLPRWEKGLDSVHAMVDLAGADPVLSAITPNWNHCKSYGGCPFQNECEKTKSDAVCVSVPKNTIAKEEVMGLTLSEKLKLGKNGSNGTSAVATQLATTIVPPDAPPPVATPEELAAAQAVLDEKPMQEALEQAKTAEASPEPPRKRGRPPKAAAALETTKPSQEPPIASGIVKSETATGLALYIGCIPTKGSGRTKILFEDWLAPIADQVAKDKMVEDYRTMSFGAGKGELAVAIRRAPVPQGDMLVPRIGSGVDEALSILIPKADFVVKSLG